MRLSSTDLAYVAAGAHFNAEQRALDFKGFSFQSHQGTVLASLWPLAAKSKPVLYLEARYGVQVYSTNWPYLFLECNEPMIPPIQERPIMINGFLAVWTGYRKTPGIRIGDDGRHWAARLDPRIECQFLDPYSLSQQTLLYLANRFFTNCEAISLLFDSRMVIELPKVYVLEHFERMRNLPNFMAGISNNRIQYHNGPLACSLRQRHRFNGVTNKYVGKRYHFTREPPILDLLHRESGVALRGYRSRSALGEGSSSWIRSMERPRPLVGRYSASFFELATKTSEYLIQDPEALARIEEVQEIGGSHAAFEGHGTQLEDFLFVIES